MNIMSENDIKLISGGINDPSYNYAVASGLLIGAIVGSSMLSAILVPLSISAGMGSIPGASIGVAVGGLGGANLLSTASSVLWKIDHKISV